jgi:hypothetical protein
MGKKAGALLWNRIRFTVPAQINGGGPGILDLDTGLTQVDKAFGNMSPSEPSFDDPSRIQVLPMVPTALWTAITHGEPFFDPTTGTIHVEFSNTDNDPVTLNALFWDPHSMIGPGQAQTYNP